MAKRMSASVIRKSESLTAVSFMKQTKVYIKEARYAVDEIHPAVCSANIVSMFEMLGINENPKAAVTTNPMIEPIALIQYLPYPAK